MKDPECIFCKLANGDIPTMKLYEDDDFAVIFDAGPATLGHALILPKEHYANIYEIDEEILAKAYKLAKKLAIVMTEAFQADGFNLLQWMDEYVEPYYFTYEYFMRFGSYPFGERPHGPEGVISTYQELFHEEDLGKTFILMMYCADESYRGHIHCPCGSGKKLRSCHGQYLFPLMTNPAIKEIIRSDVEPIRKAIIENASRNNRQETEFH